MIAREFSGLFPSSKHGIWVYAICVIFASLDKCKNSSHIAALRAAARDQHIRSRAALARFSLYGAYETIFWIILYGFDKNYVGYAPMTFGWSVHFEVDGYQIKKILLYIIYCYEIRIVIKLSLRDSGNSGLRAICDHFEYSKARPYKRSSNTNLLKPKVHQKILWSWNYVHK